MRIKLSLVPIGSVRRPFLTTNLSLFAVFGVKDTKKRYSGRRGLLQWATHTHATVFFILVMLAIVEVVFVSILAHLAVAVTIIIGTKAADGKVPATAARDEDSHAKEADAHDDKQKHRNRQRQRSPKEEVKIRIPAFECLLVV